MERAFEDFYEDVHTEFLKFGEIVNFKVCRNGSSHLRGNVYVHYSSLESAVLAYHSVNGRYFAGKQVMCEFVNVTKWKVAICGEFMKSKFKTCSRGSTCNFIHCFRNPGGDYEWADLDKPPPKHWVRKMAALFGFKDEYDKQLGSMSPDGGSYSSRRGRSRDSEIRQSKGNYDNDYEWNSRRQISRHGMYWKDYSPSGDGNEEKTQSERICHYRRRKAEIYPDDDLSDGDRKNERYHTHKTDGSRRNRGLDRYRSHYSMHADNDVSDTQPSSYGSDKKERRKREERQSKNKRKDKRGRDNESKYSDDESTREKDRKHRKGHSKLPTSLEDSYSCEDDRGNWSRSNKRRRHGHGESKRNHAADERASPHYNGDRDLHKHSSKEGTK